MRKDDTLVLVITTGLEIIGRVESFTDHTLTLLDPCVLPDIEHLSMVGDYVLYAKDNRVSFNRDMVVAEYWPSDDILILYYRFVNDEAHKIAKEIVDQTIKAEIAIFDQLPNEDIKKVRAQIKDKVITQKAEPTFSGPKVMTLEDVVEQVKEGMKKKLN